MCLKLAGCFKLWVEYERLVKDCLALRRWVDLINSRDARKKKQLQAAPSCDLGKLQFLKFVQLIFKIASRNP